MATWMPRFRLAAVVAVALISVGAPVPAHAAGGSFFYWANTPGGSGAGERRQLDDPPSNRCIALIAGDQAAGTFVDKVQNGTDTPAAVFENQDCTGHRLTVPTRATRTAGGHGPATFRSVKFPGSS